MDLNRWVCGYHRKIWFLPTRQNKAQLLLSFTLLTWVFTGSVFTSAPPADTMLGKHLPTLLSPTESRPACYTSTPKINISTILMWLTDQTAQTTDTRIHTYITEAWATDLAGADLSVDVGLLSDAVLQVRDVGLEPVPVADDGGSLHGVAALRPLPSGGQRKKWVWVLVFRSRDEILDGILHQKASSPLIIHTNGSYLELQRLID